MTDLIRKVASGPEAGLARYRDNLRRGVCPLNESGPNRPKFTSKRGHRRIFNRPSFQTAPLEYRRRLVRFLEGLCWAGTMHSESGTRPPRARRAVPSRPASAHPTRAPIGLGARLWVRREGAPDCSRGGGAPHHDLPQRSGLAMLEASGPPPSKCASSKVWRRLFPRQPRAAR
jgi:hypothetical protein